MNHLDPDVQTTIEHLTGHTIEDVCPVSGGDISSAFKLTTSGGIFFYKQDKSADSFKMYETEYRGLQYLKDHGILDLPDRSKPVQTAAFSGLIMDYITPGQPSSMAWEALGEGLAQLHRQTQLSYGFHFDNFIGRLPQSNRPHDTWSAFFYEERISPQMRMAVDSGLLSRRDIQCAERLAPRLDIIFPAEPPALLHGDLWNGNVIFGSSRPYLIDPAPSYGHREMDLAMTRLFGGFPPHFYKAYTAAYPLETGWEKRLAYGQLYYLLVHVNLFGASYVRSVRNILDKF